MQADGNNSNTGPSQQLSTDEDENDYDNEPLLPQHNNKLTGASPRLRRAKSGVSPHLKHQNDTHNNIYDGNDKYDKGWPTDEKRQSSSNKAKEGDYFFSPCRTTLNTTIQSISRIGRSALASPPPQSTHNDINSNSGQYYYDDTIDFSNDCTFGTEEGDGIWFNHSDLPGIAMAITVWILIIYCGITITLLAESKHLSHVLAYIHVTICVLALASHAKTMFADPGAIPECAVPFISTVGQEHYMCRICQSYKPPISHHCRICNRCVSRMDHHCPWVRNI